VNTQPCKTLPPQGEVRAFTQPNRGGGDGGVKAFCL